MEIISIIYAYPEWVVLVINVYKRGNGHQYKTEYVIHVHTVVVALSTLQKL